MTYHDRHLLPTSMPEATLADVLAWAELVGESYDAVCELKKAPARLGLTDDDLALVPADLGHFERTIAPSSYAAVSRSRDIDAARRRGNARLRALLTRFREAHSPRAHASDAGGREDWDQLISWIEERSSPPGRGGRFNVGKARSLYILRSRAGCAPRDLTQDDLERIARDVSADKRKILRRGVGLLEELRQERNNTIAHLLPAIELAAPRGVARLPKRAWASLPEPFRISVDLAISAALSTYDDVAANARRRLAAGDDPGEIRAAFNAAKVKPISNRIASEQGYRSAISWLVHAFEANGGHADALQDLRDVFSVDQLERAVAWQVERARRSPHHRDPERSQTLHAYLTSLRVVAGRGLQDLRLEVAVDIAFREARRFMRRPGRTPSDDITLFCRLVQTSPQVAYKIVQAPAEIARVARQRLDEVSGNTVRELTALRLFAAAAMAAVQMSRPLRTGTLRHMRSEHRPDLPGNLRRAPDGFVALFPAGEIKNDREIEFEIVGDDAAILREWITVHRPRYADLRGLALSPYLFPGEATPIKKKNSPQLPPGCMSRCSFDGLWRDAMDELGVRMTIHQCRHALATLILALHPGDYGRVATLIGDTPETAKKYYGRDDVKAAVRYVREVLLAAHPNIGHKMKGSLA